MDVVGACVANDVADFSGCISNIRGTEVSEQEIATFTAEFSTDNFESTVQHSRESRMLTRADEIGGEAMLMLLEHCISRHAAQPVARHNEHEDVKKERSKSSLGPQGRSLDRDGDGVYDEDDECPREPGPRSSDNDGCPVIEDVTPIELMQVDWSSTFQDVDIDFYADSDRLHPTSLFHLDQIASILSAFREIRIEISGHTDSSGNWDHNVDLSQRRAESVKSYLAEKGIDQARMETRGAGPQEPIDTNETPAGRVKNRRVEFKILAQ